MNACECVGVCWVRGGGAECSADEVQHAITQGGGIQQSPAKCMWRRLVRTLHLPQARGRGWGASSKLDRDVATALRGAASLKRPRKPLFVLRMRAVLSWQSESISPAADS